MNNQDMNNNIRKEEEKEVITPVEEQRDNKDLININGRISIFSITSCKHCKAAKELFNKKKLQYVDINLDEYPGRRAECQQRSNGLKTVPQIFFNSFHIGGNDKLQNLEKDGKLDELIKNVLSNPPDDDSPLPPSEADIAEADAKRMNDQNKQANIPTLLGVIPGSDEEKKILELIRKIRLPENENGISIQTRWYQLQRYHACFVGNELIDWIIKNNFESNRNDALKFAQRLIDLKLIHHVVDHNKPILDGYYFYRFYQDDDRNVLNIAQASSSSTTIKDNNIKRRSANDVANDLRKQITSIYDQFLLPGGVALDYNGVAKSEEFSRYVFACGELNSVDMSELSIPERKAIFINLYNALVIHGKIVLGNPTTVAQRGVFFTSTSYMIGGLKYSLNDIEHGILRSNKKPPYALFYPFGNSDPRRFHSLPPPADPRIHAALNCGAKSCPPVKLFHVETLEDDLTLATQAFFEDSSNYNYDSKTNTIYLTKLLDWYGVDFGSNVHEQLQTVAKFLSKDKSDVLLKVLNDKQKTYSVVYNTYNWESNDVENKL